MNREILFTALIFLLSVAGLFLVVCLLTKLLEKIFHIHFN